MVLIGDYSWVLYAVFSVLGVVLAGYFAGLFVWSMYYRTRPEREGAGREPAGTFSGGREAMHLP